MSVAAFEGWPPKTAGWVCIECFPKLRNSATRRKRVDVALARGPRGPSIATVRVRGRMLPPGGPEVLLSLVPEVTAMVVLMRRFEAETGVKPPPGFGPDVALAMLRGAGR